MTTGSSRSRGHTPHRNCLCEPPRLDLPDDVMKRRAAPAEGSAYGKLKRDSYSKGSSPHTAEPARFALAVPALARCANGEPIVALSVERYTTRSPTTVPAYLPPGPLDPNRVPEWFSHEIIRIHPRRIISWHIDPAQPDEESRNVHLAEAQERVADAPAPGETTPSRAAFDEAYTSRTTPWVIGEPQPAIVALERSGWIRGRVLDPGCGTGEHTIHLTRLGYDVRGINSSEHAIDQARANAAERNVAARFESPMRCTAPAARTR